MSTPTNGTWYKAQKSGSDFFFAAAGGTPGGGNPDTFADTYRTNDDGTLGDLSSSGNRDEAGYADASGNDPVSLVNASASYTSTTSDAHYLRFEDFSFTTSTSVTNKLYFMLKRTATSGPLYAGFEWAGQAFDQRDTTVPLTSIAKAAAKFETLNSTEKITRLSTTEGYAGTGSTVDFTDPTETDETVEVPEPGKYVLLEFLIHQTGTTTLSVTCNAYYDPTSYSLPWLTNTNKEHFAKASATVPNTSVSTYLPVLSMDANDHHKLHALMINV